MRVRRCDWAAWAGQWEARGGARRRSALAAAAMAAAAAWEGRRRYMEAVCRDAATRYCSEEDSARADALVVIESTLTVRRSLHVVRVSWFCTMRELKQVISELLGSDSKDLVWAVEGVYENLNDFEDWRRVCDAFEPSHNEAVVRIFASGP